MSVAIREIGEQTLEAIKTQPPVDTRATLLLAREMWLDALTNPDPNVRLKNRKEILDRAEGRPAQKVDITTDGGSLVKGYPEQLVDKLT